MHTAPLLTDIDPRKDDYATRVVERLLRGAVSAGASDIHLDATPSGVLIKWRVGGNLLPVATIPDGVSAKILARVKALARLITYRHDIPQEGRIQWDDQTLEARVGTLPTLHGERAVIRLVAKQTQAWYPEHLGLDGLALQRLLDELQRASGVLLISGTAGSGKTTTAYAALREVLKDDRLQRSIVSLEDPIEAEIEGVSQSPINPAVGYDWTSGLKALLRQDPEVMLVGEIREPETAAVVFQAAMAGQLVITTMHARSAADALRRLLDMQVPAHHLRSALNVLICQRLVRGLCKDCSGAGGLINKDQQIEAAEQMESVQQSDQRCAQCGGRGCHGRVLLAEVLPNIEGELARRILQDADTGTLTQVARSLGMRPLATLAAEAIAANRISASEMARHFIE